MNLIYWVQYSIYRFRRHYVDGFQRSTPLLKFILYMINLPHLDTVQCPAQESPDLSRLPSPIRMNDTKPHVTAINQPTAIQAAVRPLVMRAEYRRPLVM